MENHHSMKCDWRNFKLITGIIFSYLCSCSNYNENKIKMVMVTIPSGGALSSELRRDEATARFTEGSEPGFDQAVVIVENNLELTGLAAAAHRGGGFGCGRLQHLTWTNEELLLANLTAPPTPPARFGPVYETHIKLPTAQRLIDKIKTADLNETIEHLANLPTRHHKDGGPAVSTLVKERFEAVVKERSGVSVTLFDHEATGRTSQPSVVVRFEGQSKDQPLVILGAHLDSINSSLGADSKAPDSHAPGADDNATGIATLVAAARFIVDNNLTFYRPIELHAYAAEEVGLVGSGHIAAAYRAEDRPVAGMVQLDMTGYAKDRQPTIYLVDTHTDKGLTSRLGDLLQTYLESDFQIAALYGGTSDHKSWHDLGFPVAFPFQNPTAYNPTIHTANDLVKNLNAPSLMGRFAGLSLAYLIHEAGLIGSESAYETAMEQIKLESDIAVYFRAADSSAALQIFASTPQDHTHLSLCVLKVKQPITACRDQRFVLRDLNTAESRRLFAMESLLTPETNQQWLFISYDKNNQIIGEKRLKIVETN